MARHKCDYCNYESNQTLDTLVDVGWSFVDIRLPIRKYLQACNHCQEMMQDELKNIFKKRD